MFMSIAILLLKEMCLAKIALKIHGNVHHCKNILMLGQKVRTTHIKINKTFLSAIHSVFSEKASCKIPFYVNKYG